MSNIFGAPRSFDKFPRNDVYKMYGICMKKCMKKYTEYPPESRYFNVRDMYEKMYTEYPRNRDIVMYWICMKKRHGSFE